MGNESVRASLVFWRRDTNNKYSNLEGGEVNGVNSGLKGDEEIEEGIEAEEEFIVVGLMT